MNNKIYWCRVTKYKPWLYMPNLGPYQGDEYTSVSDIGHEFEGKILTVEDYLHDENRCIAFIIDLLDLLNISWLEIILNDNLYNPSNYSWMLECEQKLPSRLQNSCFHKFMRRLTKKELIPYSDIPYILQMIFREIVWYRLGNKKKNFKIDISEFYIHITSTLPDIEMMKLAAKYGLYVNPRFYIDGYPINVDDYRIV